jgi:hypothetical protein
MESPQLSASQAAPEASRPLLPSPGPPAHAKFSAAEDAQIKVLVDSFGEHDWYAISLRMPGRTARQCKERWANYLSPSLNTAAWTPEEDNLLLAKQREHGSRWALIAKFFPNRTDGMVKNRYNRILRRQTRVREVQLAQGPIALMWMLGIWNRGSAKQVPAPRPVVCPVLRPESPLLVDCEFESWDDGAMEFFQF